MTSKGCGFPSLPVSWPSSGLNSQSASDQTFSASSCHVGYPYGIVSKTLEERRKKITCSTAAGGRCENLDGTQRRGAVTTEFVFAATNPGVSVRAWPSKTITLRWTDHESEKSF